MPVEFIGDARATLAVSTAHRMADGVIGTEHLLTALAVAVPDIRKILDPFDLTPAVLQSVLGHRAGPWDGGDGRDRGDIEVTVAGGGELSAAANVALARCVASQDCTPEAVLDAILADRASRAAVLVRECGVDVEAVRGGQSPQRSDRVAPDLRATRDRMIGRTLYKGRSLRSNLFMTLVRVKINYALAPFMLAHLEADEIAKRRGRGPTRTDDVLVAMLATYEVAAAYPHLIQTVGDRYDGTRTLVAAGLDHRRLTAEVAARDLGDDAVPPKVLLRSPDKRERDTADLLGLLWQHEGNRSARLLKAVM